MTGSCRAAGTEPGAEGVTFEFEGRPIRGRRGESLAAALTAAGERELRKTRAGTSRGLFCGMGVCQECLVEIDGRPGQRACMTKLDRPMRVRRQSFLAPAHDLDTGRSRVAKAEVLEPDVLVLGGGAGGLNAASVAARAGAKVLLVDDEDLLRKVMKDLLEREGYKVVEARDGVEALDQVDRHGPDIIVLDLNLPGLDGYGVLSHLRSRPATADIPVVVLTARGDEDNEVRVFEHGADDFLSKPFRARALSARLAAVLVRGRRRSAPD